MTNRLLAAAAASAIGVYLAGCSGPTNPNLGQYRKELFAEVPSPFEIDFQTDGGLFVGNTEARGHVRRVDRNGNVSNFGDEILDPDALIVDRVGSIASEPGSILVGGGRIDGDPLTGRITEISPDGTRTRTLSVAGKLIEGDAPDFANPSSFAFLGDGDLLIGNFNTNTVTRLDSDTGNISPFYADPAGGSGLISVVYDRNEREVYISTGSKKLARVSTSGQVRDENLARFRRGEAPSSLAVDTEGAFKRDLFVAEAQRGGISRYDASPPEEVDPGWVNELNSNVRFNKIFGMAVSPWDRALYVAESTTGRIWKLTQAR